MWVFGTLSFKKQAIGSRIHFRIAFRITNDMLMSARSRTGRGFPALPLWDILLIRRPYGGSGLHVMLAPTNYFVAFESNSRRRCEGYLVFIPSHRIVSAFASHPERPFKRAASSAQSHARRCLTFTPLLNTNGFPAHHSLRADRPTWALTRDRTIHSGTRFESGSPNDGAVDVLTVLFERAMLDIQNEGGENK